MKIYIPKPSINPHINYTPAYGYIPQRIYTQNDMEINLAATWVYFNDTAFAKILKSFLVADFHVLEVEDLSKLERVLYGV